MKNIPQITIDTNSFINIFDKDSKTRTSIDELSQLFNMALSGQIKIGCITKLEDDLNEDKDEKRVEEMKKFLKMIPVYGSCFELDKSSLGGLDFLVDKNILKIRSEIENLLFPGADKKSKRYKNKKRDVDHIIGHYLNKRDFFVTDDTGILKKKETLANSYGIIVCKPADLISVLDNISANSKIILSNNCPDKYKSTSIMGDVFFNYSNNNGLFFIGEGVFLFGTKWSKASNNSIHAYNDHSSVKEIAVAKNINNFKEISDVSGFDFSSRCRTLRLDNKNQILIIKNVNGFLAALKILEIKDDSRGDDYDEVRFEYLILKNGETSFNI